MALFVGVDLGSTTSKAVVLDEGERVLGRGLTNTRSNYDVAAAVARVEALDDARFTLLERALSVGQGARAAELIRALRRAWVVAHCVERLGALGERVVELSGKNGSGKDARAVEQLFAGIEADADAAFGPLSDDRSRFFRDLASARFFADATAAAQEQRLAYDVAASAFDQAIVEVENGEEPSGVDRRLSRALGRAGLAAADRDGIEQAWGRLDGALEVATYVGTGYGRQRLPFPKEQIRSEILCHGLGAHALYPKTRTVLDIGGQDTKAIQLDENGLVQNFQMNDRCAAGCGRYLGYIAEEMNLGLHELGPLALQATRAVKISSTCTVFAGVELRELLALGERRENILLGLHRAILLRAMSLLSRSGGVFEELTFTGGVAKNAAVVHELKSLVAEHYGDRTLNIHPDSIYTGALGAALFAHRGGGEMPVPARGKRAPAIARTGG